MRSASPIALVLALAAMAGGVTVREWVRRFATDDPTWGDVGP